MSIVATPTYAGEFLVARRHVDFGRTHGAMCWPS